MQREITTQSPEETAQVAAEILKTCGKGKIFAIFGEMGAGKTTLVKGMCANLGVQDAVSSPTFALVNEYSAREGKVFHFDFYRIRHIEEAYDIGYEEYFGSGQTCLVEWPEKVESLLPDDCVTVTLRATGPNSRIITWTCS
jgi:tRNA threonylcarbamoyladenosine biosynthesis protein TsaE